MMIKYFYIINVFSELKETDFSQKELEDKWAQIFKNKYLVQMKKLVSIYLSIAPSNAFCECVFSLVNNVWTDERNSFKISTVNAIVCVKANAEFDCSQSFELFLSDPQLLKKSTENEKYNSHTAPTTSMVES